jgi:hypothetical protein
VILGCLVTKFAWEPSNWKKKKQIILPINIEEISYTGGIGRSISQKRKAKKHYTSHSLPKDTKNHIPVIPKPSRQPYR